jgi:hypothetical protein
MEESKGKSALLKPENWVGWLVLGGLGLLGFHFLDVILPMITRVLENLIYTCVLTAVLGFITWIALSKDLHRAIVPLYMIGIRWLTQWVVDIDPIAIMKTYSRTLKDRYKSLSEALASLREQKRKLTQLLKTKALDYDLSMRRADEARKMGGAPGMDTEFSLQARKAGRLEKSSMTYQGLLNTIDAHIARTGKIQEVTRFIMLDIADTIEEESEKRTIITSAFRAMKSAQAILAADRDRELFDMGLESTQKDYFQKLGEIDEFMEDTSSLINGMDLDKNIYSADVMEKLKKWDQRLPSLLEGGSGKTKYRVDGIPTYEGEDLPVPGVDTKKQSFADVFDKLD